MSQVNRQQRLRIQNVPAPVGGWNARDALASMPPTDAVILTNMFPNASSVTVRTGSKNWATGLGAQVNSVMGYNPASGTPKLYAAAGSNFYDVTAGGAVGAAVLTGMSSDKWQHINFATSAGPFLLMVNGIDGYYVYNGTTWQSVTAVSSPISITGVDPTTLIHLCIFASRVWFVQKNSLKVWYLPVSSVGGAAASLDLSPLLIRGGSVVAMGVQTIDGGYGMQDQLCIVTSEGEVIVYQGTDPTQSTTFSLVGKYQLGTPMGNRCFMKFGADLLYISKDGLGAMSKALTSTRVSSASQMTDKIQTAISNVTTSYAANYGWDMVLHPVGNALLLNVPAGVGQQQQYVMNTITGAWCNFTGWPANCWERYNDVLYFGGNGVVTKAWQFTYDDNGAQINGEALPAFSYFGTEQIKQFTMARPVIQTAGVPGVLLGMNVDYDVTPPVGLPSFTQSAYALWNTGLWDQGIWGADLVVKKDWQFVGGVGYAGALHMKMSVKDTVASWVSTDYAMQSGGVL